MVTFFLIGLLSLTYRSRLTISFLNGTLRLNQPMVYSDQFSGSCHSFLRCFLLFWWSCKTWNSCHFCNFCDFTLCLFSHGIDGSFIDGLPLLNMVIFHGCVSFNQMVLYIQLLWDMIKLVKQTFVDQMGTRGALWF